LAEQLNAQTPFEQLAIEFASAGQALAHAPQLATALARFVSQPSARFPLQSP
jgi:hypothetical protein